MVCSIIHSLSPFMSLISGGRETGDLKSKRMAKIAELSENIRSTYKVYTCTPQHAACAARRLRFLVGHSVCLFVVY